MQWLAVYHFGVTRCNGFAGEQRWRFLQLFNRLDHARLTAFFLASQITTSRKCYRTMEPYPLSPCLLGQTVGLHMLGGDSRIFLSKSAGRGLKSQNSTSLRDIASSMAFVWCDRIGWCRRQLKSHTARDCEFLMTDRVAPLGQP